MKLYCENCDFVDSCGAKRKEFFSNPKAVYTVCYLKRISGNPVNYEPDSVWHNAGDNKMREYSSGRTLEKTEEANGSLVVKSETT